MRTALVVLLVLLGGCAGDAPDPASEDPAPAAPAARVDAAATTAYVAWDAVGDTTVRGQRAEPWDAGAELGLPRPFTALLVEMRCSGSVQEAESPWPQLLATATLDDAAGNPHEASGGGNDACQPVAYDLASADYGGSAVLKTLRVDASFTGNTYTLGADVQVEFAATLFLEGPVPEGYTAFA